MALWRVERQRCGESRATVPALGAVAGRKDFFLRSHGDRRLVELTDARLGVRVTGGGRFELFYSWNGR